MKVHIALEARAFITYPFHHSSSHDFITLIVLYSIYLPYIRKLKHDSPFKIVPPYRLQRKQGVFLV